MPNLTFPPQPLWSIGMFLEVKFLLPLGACWSLASWVAGRKTCPFRHILFPLLQNRFTKRSCNQLQRSLKKPAPFKQPIPMKDWDSRKSKLQQLQWCDLFGRIRLFIIKSWTEMLFIIKGPLLFLSFSFYVPTLHHIQKLSSQKGWNQYSILVN